MEDLDESNDNFFSINLCETGEIPFINAKGEIYCKKATKLDNKLLANILNKLSLKRLKRAVLELIEYRVDDESDISEEGGFIGKDDLMMQSEDSQILSEDVEYDEKDDDMETSDSQKLTSEEEFFGDEEETEDDYDEEAEEQLLKYFNNQTPSTEEEEYPSAEDDVLDEGDFYDDD